MLITLILLGAAQAAAFVPSGIDLLALPLPSDEPQIARAGVRCELTQQRFCERIVDRLLTVPFAWHRTGYEIIVLDALPPVVADASVSGTPFGAALKHDRELHLYYPQLRHVPPTTQIGITALTNDLDRSLAHEVGHTFHQTCNERAFLRSWRDVRGIEPGAPRHGRTRGGTAFSSVAEDVAEAAVVYLLGGKYDSRTGLDAHELSADHLAQLSGFFRVCARPGSAGFINQEDDPEPSAAR